MKGFGLGTLLLCLLAVTPVQAQFNYQLELDTFSLTTPPALHSGAFANWNGKWFFLGGRRNGLHGFLPPFAFPTTDANTDIWMVNPALNQTVLSSADSLPDALREPVESSNMEYYQQDSMLYMVGGYGWRNANNAFYTFPTLTAVNLRKLDQAITTQSSVVPAFRQISDTLLKVCGGQLEKMDSVFYLVFGHSFDGTYNVVDTLGNFVQRYTRDIRQFQLHDDGTLLSLYHESAVHDSANYRRRDFNLVPQIFPNGQYGFTAFAGVFQQGINLPYLHPIDIQSSGPTLVPGFSQHLNQYHSATLPAYDQAGNNMYTLFFGGMSMYRLDTALQTLVTDSMVPFVKTISLVHRDMNGVLSEYKLPQEWNSYEGTDAYFILNNNIPLLQNRIVNLDSIHQKTLVGYIVGGIISPDSNISQTGSTLSHASSNLYKVYLKLPDTDIGLHPIEEPLRLECSPNPFAGKLNINLELTTAQQVELSVVDIYGATVATILNKNMSPGNWHFSWNAKKLSAGVYYIKVRTPKFLKATPVILNNE